MIDQDRVTKFTVITGPRGASKTLFMTSLVVNKLIKAYIRKLLGYPERKVWTNYPVGLTCHSPEGKYVYLESEPLNMEAFYIFSADLANGDAFIDEIDQWFDRQGWQSTTQKLLNKGMTQIRKKKLSITSTLQDFAWMNNRGEFQTDTIVKCRESAFTPWGKKQGVDLGEVGFLTFRDKSGISTGYAYEESGQEFQLVFQGKRFWDCYDTDLVFDPTESMTKYKIKGPPVKEILLPGAEESPSKMNSRGHMNYDQKSDEDVKYLDDMLKSTISEYKSTGNTVFKRRLLVGKVLDKTGNLYSQDEIEDQLAKIPGLKAFHGSNNSFCKIEKYGELVPA